MREWERMEREQRSRAREDFEREERQRDRGTDRELGGFGSYLEEGRIEDASPPTIHPTNVGVVYWQPEHEESEHRQDRTMTLTFRKRALLSPGETLWVVGNALSMGGWDPSRGVQLMPVSLLFCTSVVTGDVSLAAWYFALWLCCSHNVHSNALASQAAHQARHVWRDSDRQAHTQHERMHAPAKI
jgi:hypothetical protein